MGIKNKNSNLVIAAAGSGKTTELIKRVEKSIERLSPNKMLAVITYTNTATNEIKSRLEGKINIPKNVFIGTIHSFLINFLIKPYGHVLELVPNDLIITDYQIKLKPKEKSDYIRLHSIEDSLLKKGILNYDKIMTVSNKILENNLVKERFCERVDFLFVDEFQDSSDGQFKVFEVLRKGKKTNVTLFGDPEQKIMSFQSRKSTKNKEGKIKQHPIVSLQEKTVYNLEKLSNNYRSSKTIVNFINNFHSCIEQVYANKDITSENDVLFIRGTDVENIIKAFNYLCNNKEYCKNNPKSKFFLAYENKLLEKYKSVDVDILQKETNIMDYVIEYILQLYNVKRMDLLEFLGIDIIELRKICLNIFFYIKDNNDIKYEDVFIKIKEEFVVEFDIENSGDVKFEKIDITEKFIKDINKMCKTNIILNEASKDVAIEFFLTIHKSKGMQADAVLVVAKTENELLNWLETNKEKRLMAATDSCRLGYVAFSRAKEFLCLACKQEIKPETVTILEGLGVKVIKI